MSMIKYLAYLAIAGLAFIAGLSSYYSIESIRRQLRIVLAGHAETPIPTIESISIPEPNVVLQIDQAESAGTDLALDLNLTGDYYMSGERPPRGFEDFKFLEIETHKYDALTELKKTGNPWEPIPPRGTFRTQRTFKLRRISIGLVHISFETERKNGISYRFVGQLGVSNETNEGNASPDIFGKLLKLRNGTVIATTKAEFYISGC